MSERGGFNPELQARLAHERERMKEEAREFLPESINKETLASSFNLAPEDISDDEIREIQEFAVNAGMDMVRAAEGVDNDVNFHGYHDIFHAADIMRKSQGASATPDFATSPRSERYTSGRIMTEELYPLLFFGITDTQPLSIAIMTPEGRAELADALREKFGIDNIKGLEVLDAISEETPEAFQHLYEEVVKDILIANGERALKEAEREDLTERFVEDTEHLFARANWPEHYKELAARIFGGEWVVNKRLLLDQFLQDIRSLKHPQEVKK